MIKAQLRSIQNSKMSVKIDIFEDIGCIFEEFQGSLNSRFADDAAARPLFVHEKIHTHFFKVILIKNLRRFQNSCIKKSKFFSIYILISTVKIE